MLMTLLSRRLLAGWLIGALSGGAASALSTNGAVNGHTSSSSTRWGILSSGKIASDFCQALSITDGSQASAVAARKQSSARQFAQRHDIPKHYGSYDDLFADPDIDVVYIGSVADQHFDLTTKSLKAGKPTVVEKPLGLSLEQTQQLVELAESQNCFLMEGMWTRCFPAMHKVQDLINNNAIGYPVIVQGDFGWSTADCGKDDRIWYPDSGGMTLDIAMYLAQLGPVAFGSDATVGNVQAMGSTKNGVDHTALVNCQYNFFPHNSKKNQPPRTGFLQFHVTGEANTEERVVIQGTKGRIIIASPAHIPSQITVELEKERGKTTSETIDFPLPDDSFASWNYPGSVGFTYQIDAVRDALKRGLKECPDFTWKDSLQVADMLDKIRDQVLSSAGTTINGDKTESFQPSNGEKVQIPQ